MKIGYGKLGRSCPLQLEKCKTVGGDTEFTAVVKELALRRPDDTFFLIGRNSGELPSEVGLPSNVINPWTFWREDIRLWRNSNGITGPLSIEDQLKTVDWYRQNISPVIKNMDHVVVWIGQHGSTNSPKPFVNDPSLLTKPHDWEVNYCAYLLEGINDWRDQDPLTYEEISLNADARNYHKMRDLRWPLRRPVLAQYEMTSSVHHSRYDPIPRWWSEWAWEGPDNMWDSDVRYEYFRVEICGLSPRTPFGELLSFNDCVQGKKKFGLFINEARCTRKGWDRLTAMKRYVLPLEPAFVHGKWSDDSQIALGREIVTVPWTDYVPLLHSVCSTFTTPSSGSGWATTKPWEAFAAGTVCFFHPYYDDQDHILHDAPKELSYLRVSSPEELRRKVDEVFDDVTLFRDLISAQRIHFERAIDELTYMKEIERRIDL